MGGGGLCMVPPGAHAARGWIVNSIIRPVGTERELALGFPFAIAIFQRRGWK